MQFFITGTDTHIGKTVVSAWLCTQLKASYWKPIQTGSMEGTDTSWIQSLGISTYPESYCYQAPLSPHLAAAQEGDTIALSSIKLPTDQPLVVEGAGGVLVPLNERCLMIDLIQALHLPTIVVASTRLGTINHTLLTIEALKHRSIPIKGIILNGLPNADIIEAIEYFSQTPILLTLPQWPVITKEDLENTRNAKLLNQEKWG